MLCTTNVIVLSKLKYKDNDLIVKSYTEAYGVVSFLVKGVLKSKKASTKIAYFQPLSQLQIVFNYTKKKTLYIPKDVKINTIYSSLHTHLLKSTIVMFLSEVLSLILQEEEQNAALYNYLKTVLLWFDEDTAYSNFHLLFLLDLTKYLGFYPDTTKTAFNHFNLEQGHFEIKPTGKYTVSGEEVILLKNLLGTTFDELSTIKINAAKRQSFLNMILLYFKLHLGNFKTPNSLQVLNQVFN